MFAFDESYSDDMGLMVLSLEGRGERTRDEIIWQHLDKIPEVPCPVAHGNFVYMLKNGGRLTCMDAEIGKESGTKEILKRLTNIWREKLYIREGTKSMDWKSSTRSMVRIGLHFMIQKL